MEVFVKYVTGTPGNNTWTTDLANTMLSIANNAAGVVVDGGAAGSIGNQTFPFAGFINRTAESGAPPKAYLNWLVFNKSDVLVDFGYIPITTAAQESGANGAHEHLKKDNLVVREPGYVYIYLSNESPTSVEVFFDDFKVEHIKSPVVAIDDYYPFGLTFNGYHRENAVENRYLYNGKELQNELDLGWYDYQARQYDPIIGRFLSVDPAADLMRRFSTYSYSFDNPIRFTDPDGMIPEQATGGDQEDPKKKKQQEQQTVQQAWDKASTAEKVVTFLILLMDEFGGAVNQMNGNESDDLGSNIQTAANTVNDVVMTVQGTNEILTSGPASGKNLTEDAVSQGKNVATKVDDAVNITKSTASTAKNTLEPGPYAGKSIPARSTARDFTKAERGTINEIGADTGCHTCGSTNPGTKSGNFIPDHQPPSALINPGTAQQLYPHCKSCSASQGGTISQMGRTIKKIDDL